MAGLLDFYSNPNSMGMLGLAGGLLEAGGPSRLPVGFGQALGRGLLQGGHMAQSTAHQQLAQSYLGEQLKTLQTSNARQAQLSPILAQMAARLQGGAQAPQGAPQQVGVSDSSAAAVGAPWAAASQLPQPQAQQQAGGLPFSLEDITLLKMIGGPDLTSAYTAGRPNLAVEGGLMLDRHRGVVGSVPQTNQQGFSTMTEPDGRGGWRVRTVPGAAEAFGQQQDITEGAKARFDLVDVPLSDGRTVKMPRADAVRMLGQQQAPAQPAPAVPASPAAPAVAPRPPAARFGETPSAAETAASQARAREQAQQDVAGSPGQQAADRKFGEEYAAFKAGGGFADAEKNISQLSQQLTRLRTQEGLTGKRIGMTPDSALQFTDPEAYSTKEQIEEVVQRNLRLILGAQFAEKEGERLIKRAYNPALEQSDNAMRIERLLASMQTGLAAKKSAAEYFEKNGTLRGWGGKLPTMSDFMEAVGGDGGGPKVLNWSDLKSGR